MKKTGARIVSESILYENMQTCIVDISQWILSCDSIQFEMCVCENLVSSRSRSGPNETFSNSLVMK